MEGGEKEGVPLLVAESRSERCVWSRALCAPTTSGVQSQHVII